MMHIAEYRAQLLSEMALAANKLSLGILMDPAEVARTIPPKHNAADSGRWWLCGNMHRAMFAAAQKHPVRHLGKVIVTAEGTKYLVLAQQACEWQHRVLLQVAGRQVLDFLGASLEEGFDLSLGLTGGDESLLVQDCRFVKSLVGDIALRDESGGKNISAHRLRQEACMVAVTLLSPAAVTVAELPLPEHVCVSIVASSELVAAVMKEDNHSR
jgi:hypothetical protein